MFTQTKFKANQPFPQLPIKDAVFQAMLQEFGVVQGDKASPGFRDLACHALKAWESGTATYALNQTVPLVAAPGYKRLQSLGIIDAIVSPLRTPDHIVVDGGVKDVVDYRLKHLDSLLKSRQLQCTDITLFAGQCLHRHTPIELRRLIKTGVDLKSCATPIIYQWLEAELRKDPANPNPWKRPFATEYETAVLSLLELYKADLVQAGGAVVFGDKPIDVSIPKRSIRAGFFLAKGRTITVLNSAAVRRKFGDYTLPLSEARPTGASCFRDWLRLAQPKTGASVLLVSHNPNIYRSLLDLLRVCQTERPDLTIASAGAGARADCTYADALRSLGKIIAVSYQQAYPKDPVGVADCGVLPHFKPKKTPMLAARAPQQRSLVLARG